MRLVCRRFSIPDRLGDSFRHARRRPRGKWIKTSADHRIEAGQAEAGLGGAGAGKSPMAPAGGHARPGHGRCQHQAAGSAIGRDLGPTHIGRASVCRSIPTRMWLAQIICLPAARMTDQEPGRRAERRLRARLSRALRVVDRLADPVTAPQAGPPGRIFIICEGCGVSWFTCSPVGAPSRRRVAAGYRIRFRPGRRGCASASLPP